GSSRPSRSWTSTAARACPPGHEAWRSASASAPPAAPCGMRKSGRRSSGASPPSGRRSPVSAYERPDLAALAELERLVVALTEELAGWRRRCLASETELQELRTQGGAA